MARRVTVGQTNAWHRAVRAPDYLVLSCEARPMN
jgi:hypothetical protein